MSQNQSILFVCMGNICRSPAADGIFTDFVARYDLEESISVDSAGTHGYHIGDLSDPRMLDAAKNRGFELRSRARQVTPQDLQDFDLVLAMDQDNLSMIEALDDNNKSKTRHAQVLLFSHFLDDAWPTDVPDPYYGGEEGFEKVLDMIQTACPAILEWLRARLNTSVS